MKRHPDPFTELQMTTLHPVRGANYWSRHPVIRMDVRIGAYEEISSADVPGFTEALNRALPGLAEHHCSVGRRGGFNERLRDGTYAAHIMEHVALELQSMIGHDVGYGRTRGTGETAHYTVVLEHRHELVGIRATALAFAIVQRAFAGTLADITHCIEELRAIAESPPIELISHRVWCGVTGGNGRAEACAGLAELWRDETEPRVIADVSPASLLLAGLPYAHASIALIFDNTIHDVPERYRDGECSARLLAIVADALPPDGVVVCPREASDVHEAVRRAKRAVHTFPSSDNLSIHIRNAVLAVSNATPALQGITHAPGGND